jgi:hypothetical protein
VQHAADGRVDTRFCTTHPDETITIELAAPARVHRLRLKPVAGLADAKITPIDALQVAFAQRSTGGCVTSFTVEPDPNYEGWEAHDVGGVGGCETRTVQVVIASTARQGAAAALVCIDEIELFGEEDSP